MPLPENKIVNTVFRFVAIRNPQKPEEADMTNGFVSYDEASSSSFLTSLKTVRTNAQLDAEAQVTQLKLLANTFLNGTSGLKTLKSVDVLVKELVACGDWLKRNRAKITRDKALTRPTVAVAQQSATNIARLWDNLFAYEIVGGVPEAKQAIMSALLADHYIKKEALQTTDADYLRVSRAEILLPNSVFPLPRKAVTQPTTTAITSTLERDIAVGCGSTLM